MSNDTATTPHSLDDKKDDLDGSLVRGLAWNASVKWGNQLLAWASTLIVVRLLTPDDYGVVGMATVYLGLVTLICEFGVGTTVITLRELSTEQIAQLNGLSLLLGLGGFILSCLAAVPLANFFRSPRLPWVVVAMSTNFVISSLQAVPSALLQKDLRFKLVSLIDGVRAFVLSFATVLFAWLGLRYWTLVLGSILGTFIGATLTLSRRRCGFALPQASSLRHVIPFTKHILVNRLAWYTYSNSDFLISGRVLGQAALGAYTTAWNLASVPVEKVTGVLNSVTPALFSAVQNEKAMLRRYLLNLTEGISVITIPLSIGLGLVAREFVLLALGKKWEPVIAPLRFLAFYVSLRSIAPMIPAVLNVTGETRFTMRNSIAAVAILPTSFYIASRWGNAGIAAGWMVGYPLVALPLFHRAFQKIELRWIDYFRVLRPSLAGALVMTIVVLILKQSLLLDYPVAARLALEVLSGAGAYILVAGTLNFKRRHNLLKILRLLRSPVVGIN